MTVEIKLAYNNKNEIRELFEEYTNMLIESSEKMAEYLKIQNYDYEIENLEYKYGMPKGRLYLVSVDGKVAGCIGLRDMGDDCCEMKRLYIRPEFRGYKLGHLLANQIIDDAKSIGYKYMYLDSLTFLKSAVGLYKTFGFSEIEPYIDTPLEESIFMRLKLN